MIRWFLDTLDDGKRIDIRNAHRFQLSPPVVNHYTDFLKIICVREPLRRLVSFYLHWVVHNSRLWSFADHAQRFSLRDKTFRQFLFVLDHLQCHNIGLQHHLIPQVHLLDGIEFDEFVLLEQVEAGLHRLQQRLKTTAEVTRRNARSYDHSLKIAATDRTPAQLRRHGIPAAEWFYDDETRALAAKLYAADIAFYQFAQTRNGQKQPALTSIG
jgi:hypothetical protein